MRYLSLFSGIEAATQAWQSMGWECVAVSEIEPFPCAVLEHHYPNVPNLGDVTKITEQQIKDLGQIDLIVFGSPCQNLSVAGNRKGFEGEQSGLFFEAMRIINYAKQHSGCRFALWENVPGAFSSNKGADFSAVVGQMAGLRDVDVPKNGWGKEGAALGDNGLLEWSVLDAQWFGLAQRRKRVFAIVDFGDWTSRPPILLERESLRGDTAPSRETGQSAAANVGASAKTKAFTKVSACLYAAYGTKWNGNGAAYDGSLFALQPEQVWYSVDTQQPPARLAREIAPCLAASMYKEPPSVTAFAEPSRASALDVFTGKDVTPTLMAAMGTGGNNLTMICQQAYSFDSLSSNSMKSNNPHSGCRQVELAKCLDTSNGCPSKNQGGIAVVEPIAIAGNIIGRAPKNGGNHNGFDESGACYTLTTVDRHAVCVGGQHPNASINTDGSCPTLTSAMGIGGGHVPIAAYPINTMNCQGRPSDNGRMGLGLGSNSDPSPTLTKAHSHAVAYGCNLRPQEVGVAHEMSQTLRASDYKEQPSVLIQSVVRRLTPIECERLQGFPDSFTKIPYRNKPADDCPNGVRYKALGNSMAVNVMAWIGAQIQKTISI